MMDTINYVGGNVGVAISVTSVRRNVIMSIVIIIDGGDVIDTIIVNVRGGVEVAISVTSVIGSVIETIVVIIDETDVIDTTIVNG